MKIGWCIVAAVIAGCSEPTYSADTSDDSGTGSEGGGNDVVTMDGGGPSDTGTGNDTGNGQDVQVQPEAGCLPRGSEDTNALCSNGIDDDCNGYTDCNDYHCSRNPAVTVCNDAGTPPTDSGPPPDVPAGAVGPNGGTVSLLHFAVFGDVRPPTDNDTTNYPTPIITAVMQEIQSQGAQFAIATGDYMFASYSSSVSAQLDQFQQAEQGYSGYVFHGMGNHECNGMTPYMCGSTSETPNIQGYMSRLNAGRSLPYFDWFVNTSMGAAHFISTAPNFSENSSCTGTAQQTWLHAALQMSATYTIVMAHEGPDAYNPPPCSAMIEQEVSGAPNVTLRLYGHTHEYHHLTSAGYNVAVDGNAGAQLDGSYGPTNGYGVAFITQQANGNLAFDEYELIDSSGSTLSSPMLLDSWVVTPSGARGN